MKQANFPLYDRISRKMERKVRRGDDPLQYMSKFPDKMLSISIERNYDYLSNIILLFIIQYCEIHKINVNKLEMKGETNTSLDMSKLPDDLKRIIILTYQLSIPSEGNR